MRGSSGARIMDLFSPKIRNQLPRLSQANSRKTSEADPRYNCFGWAAFGNESIYMAPVPPGYFWPEGVPRNCKLESVVQAFTSLGFVPCDNGELEHGFEKIAIYATSGYAEHAARQKPNGRWTSKLGEEQDIEHDAPECAAGGVYGEVARYLKRGPENPVP